MNVGRLSFGPLSTSTLGFEKFLNDVEKLMDADIQKQTTSTFPPHNIIKLDENKYVVELAVAGFSKDEIVVQVEDGTLTITGEKVQNKQKVTYLHRGIGTRSFVKKLTVADTIEVKGAEYKDGILRIGLENIVPEHKKPRNIQIVDEMKDFEQKLLQE